MMNFKDFTQLMSSFALAQPHGAPDFTNPNVSAIWFGIFQKKSLDEMRNAMIALVQRGFHFPQISDVSRYFGTTSDPKEAGLLMANKILESIGKFGGYNHEGARAHLGEKGWQAVQMFGGWKNLCDAVDYSNMETNRAQLRDLCIAVETSGVRAPEERKILPESQRGHLRAALDSVSTPAIKPMQNALK